MRRQGKRERERESEKEGESKVYGMKQRDWRQRKGRDVGVVIVVPIALSRPDGIWMRDDDRIGEH